jgi:hypothetical protein
MEEKLEEKKETSLEMETNFNLFKEDGFLLNKK